jgi:hypothetical protein
MEVNYLNVKINKIIALASLKLIFIVGLCVSQAEGEKNDVFKKNKINILCP